MRTDYRSRLRYGIASGGCGESRQRQRQPTPISQRKAAYLVYNNCASSNHGTEWARWDVYTVDAGQREYHYTAAKLAVVVAFAVRHNLRIVNEDGELNRVWEVEDAA
jgi:hypothetical protein